MSRLGITRSDPQSVAALVAAASGASVAAIGSLVVAGWLTVAATLIHVLPGFPAMQYNTALGFMICGAGLLTAALDLRRPTALLGVLAGFIGLATLFQYVFQSDLGIDQVLLESYILTGVSSPGRMGPNSAFALTLTGAGLVSLVWRPAYRHWHAGPALLGSVVIAVGIAALVGYVGGVPGAYGWSHLQPMAIHSAIGVTLLGGGIVGLAWNAAEADSREAPAWLALVAAAVVATVTVCLWHALSGGAPPVLAPRVPAPVPASTLPNVTLATGLLTAMLLGWSVREGQISRRRARSLEAANRTLHEEIQTRIRMEQDIQQFAALVESSEDAILATTLDGRIMTWNPGAERLYGYTRAEVVGKDVSMLHGGNHNGAEVFRQLANGERVSRLETVNLTREGRRIDVSLTISPILDQSGRVVSASTIAHDITSRKLLDRMKDDFVGTVSHELRTPLTAIKGFIELVADGDAGPVTDTQRDFLEIAARNSDKLGVLINDLIDMNLIESQRLEIRPEPLDLVSVLADVASTFRTMARTKGLAFRESVAPLPQVRGDSARLIQVFSNLVSNAIKYTPKGEVGIQAVATAAGVEVTVHDTGIGLSMEEHGQLFTRFFRGQNTVVAEAGGTGLGLVIAQAIIGRHHGKIDVESRPGEGSRFRVTLPALVPDATGPDGFRSA
ncbi:MAG: ATP-binding protein [Gemmatimonadales bacterium]